MHVGAADEAQGAARNAIYIFSAQQLMQHVLRWSDLIILDTTIEIALTFFVMLMVVAQLVSLRFKIPYTLVLVFIGIAITVLPVAALGSNPISSVIQISVSWIQSVYNQLVGSGLFVGLIVPPLIFEATIHIKRRELNAVIRPAIALATVGVLISIAVASLLLWKVAGLSVSLAVLFAVIIAPTDTITVLQLFKRIKVPAKLSTLMDMEASLNDATAIVIFTILLSSEGIRYSSIFGYIGIFLYSFLVGTAIGLAVALASKFVHERIDDKLAETTLTIAAVYGSYVLATSLGAAGLVAVVIVGLYFGNSTMNSSAISKQSRQSILSFWEIAAFIGNAVAFLLIGFETNLSIFLGAYGIILVAYVATLIARAATVYPTMALFNQAGDKIPLQWSNIATLGGVRGALSIALLATIAATTSISGTELSVLTAMVLGVVFLSLVLQVPLLSNYTARLFGRHKTPHYAQ